MTIHLPQWEEREREREREREKAGGGERGGGGGTRSDKEAKKCILFVRQTCR